MTNVTDPFSKSLGIYIIYSTRSVDLWYFQIHKLFFGARMDGVYFRSFPKLMELIKIGTKYRI